MELKLFPDLIAALGKVANWLKAIANLANSERAKYRQVMDDTYRLIDTTLNMVIFRLGDIQSSDNDHDYIQEVTKLNNYSYWMQVDREFLFFKNLLAAFLQEHSLLSLLRDFFSFALLQHSSMSKEIKLFQKRIDQRHSRKRLQWASYKRFHLALTGGD